MITLYLVSKGILDKPLLYLSEFFEKNKELYYDNLTLVRTKNDLDRWIRFFLIGVIETATRSSETLQKILVLKSTIEKERIILMGKRSTQGLALFHKLFSKPVVNIRDVQTFTGLSPKAANDLVQIFVDKKILTESTGYRRNRVFIFTEYMEMFDSR